MNSFTHDLVRLLARLLIPAAGALLAFATAVSAQQLPALEGYVQEGLRNNYALRQQRLTAEKTEAAVRQARGLFLPSATLDARYSETHGVVNMGDLVNPAYAALNQLTGTNNFPTNIDARLPFAQETRLRVAQPIFNPAISSNYQVQKSVAEIEAAGTGSNARQLVADVQLAYLNYARAARIAELYQNTRLLLQENVRVNERLLANGKVTPAALHRAIADRSEVEQQIAQAEQQRSAAARYFNYLLGRVPGDELTLIPDSLLEVSLSISADDAVRSGLARREELRQAEGGIKVAEAQQRLARASFLPSVALAVDYGIQGNEYRFDTRNDVAIASLVVSWNVFNGGQDMAKRQQASIDVERSELRLKEAEHQIEMQVRQAYDAVTVSRRAIDAATDRLRAARRSFELVERRHAEGMAPQIEYIDARTSLTNAEFNSILTQYQHAANYVELERVAALRQLADGERNK
ncbi:MAG TPA: TolC family protein [Longimicrobiales bacterium]|nr:TolC family protein [Longimicrobiales bacterium]